MGFDEPSWKLKSRAAQAEQQHTLDRFDRFLIRSEHDVRTLAKAFRLREKALLRVGYPRNDVLVQARGATERPPLAAELGIPADRKILLYAPTFRQSGQKRFALPSSPTPRAPMPTLRAPPNGWASPIISSSCWRSRSS